MIWVVLAVLVAFFVVAGRVLRKRQARQPLRMPYRTGHTQGMGEAPSFPHHRTGRRD